MAPHPNATYHDNGTNEPKEGQPSWLFSIGALCNPYAIRMRGVAPIETRPARVSGWKRMFLAPRGMATLFPDDNSSVIGVAHLVHPDAFKILDVIERAYVKKEVEIQVLCHMEDTEQNIGVEPVVEKTVRGLVYVMGEERLRIEGTTECPPTARYLDIITQGLAVAGAPPALVRQLRAKQATPRPTTEEMSTFPVAKGVEFKAYRLEDIEKTKVDPCNALLIFNGKVLRHDGSERGVSWKSDRTTKFFQDNGHDMTMFYARTYFEPQLGPVYEKNDLTPAHARFVEDMLSRPTGLMYGWEIIGALDTSPRTENCHGIKLYS